MLAVYATLVLARVPALVWPGRFWAEEGAIYVASAATHSAWEVLTTPVLGYYSLYNLVAALAATRLVPLELAPVVTLAFAFLAQLLPAWLILYALFPERRALGAWAVGLLLVVLPTDEVWLNTINSQFYLAAATAIVLASGPPTAGTRGVRLAALVVAGLTGVVSCLLAPLFWVDAAWHRNRGRVVEAMVLTVPLLVQLAVVLAGTGRSGHRFFELVPFVLLSKQIVLVTMGEGAANWLYATVAGPHLFESGSAIVLALVPHLLIAVGLIRWGGRSAQLLFAGSLLVACVSFMHALDAASFEGMVGHLDPWSAGRYYYAPNAMLALALVSVLARSRSSSPFKRVFRAGCAVYLGAATLVGASHYLDTRGFDGPSWPAEVQRWRRGESQEIAIWPRPWTMTLPRSPDVPTPEAPRRPPSL